MSAASRSRFAAVLERPSWPESLARPTPKRRIGVDYDTTWTRRPLARAARNALVDTVTVPSVRVVAKPVVFGNEHLEALKGPAIFTANHTSHLDTAVVLAALPPRFRHQCVVAAAADYFFDRQWKATLWSFSLGTIPMERTRVNRKSADLAASLLDEGWNLVIFPEGGRSPDGWGQEFRGGAAYLAKRCAVPVVPIHLRGVRPIFPKGASRPRRGSVEVRIGTPLRPLRRDDGSDKAEDARRFAARVEAAVAELADEAETDWWSARQRAASGATPPFRGPDIAPWRRAWTLPESSRGRPSSKRDVSPEPWQQWP